MKYFRVIICGVIIGVFFVFGSKVLAVDLNKLSEEPKKVEKQGKKLLTKKVYFEHIKNIAYSNDPNGNRFSSDIIKAIYSREISEVLKNSYGVNTRKKMVGYFI